VKRAGSTRSTLVAASHVDAIARSIMIVRSQRVLLDVYLARLYGVSTKALNQAVKRNAARFPTDFCFRLTAKELASLNRSHFVTGSQKHRNPRKTPTVFTEHGAIMAAAILNSAMAVQTSLHVVRAFVRLRELLASHSTLMRRLDDLERKYGHQDKVIAAILSTLRELATPATPKRRGIGFTADLDEPQPGEAVSRSRSLSATVRRDSRRRP
jgi:hypothetical protein